MKRLFVLVLLALAAWYGWKHYPELLQNRGGHDAVIENNTGHPMERIRLTVDGQTLVKESLPDGQKVVIPFKVQNDASFHLEYEFGDIMGIRTWSGGMVPRGPMMQRHIMTVDPDGEVLYRAENK